MFRIISDFPACDARNMPGNTLLSREFVTAVAGEPPIRRPKLNCRPTVERHVPVTLAPRRPVSTRPMLERLDVRYLACRHMDDADPGERSVLDDQAYEEDARLGTGNGVGRECLVRQDVLAVPACEHVGVGHEGLDRGERVGFSGGEQLPIRIGIETRLIEQDVDNCTGLIFGHGSRSVR